MHLKSGPCIMPQQAPPAAPAACYNTWHPNTSCPRLASQTDKQLGNHLSLVLSLALSLALSPALFHSLSLALPCCLSYTHAHAHTHVRAHTHTHTHTSFDRHVCGAVSISFSGLFILVCFFASIAASHLLQFLPLLFTPRPLPSPLQLIPPLSISISSYHTRLLCVFSLSFAAIHLYFLFSLL